MQEFEALADYCLNYFKNNYKYELDNIFIDQIQYPFRNKFFDKNILIQFLKECKEKLIDMKSSIFVLHSRNEKYGHEIKKYEKSDYNAKLEFLKSINQEGFNC